MLSAGREGMRRNLGVKACIGMGQSKKFLKLV